MTVFLDSYVTAVLTFYSDKPCSRRNTSSYGNSSIHNTSSELLNNPNMVSYINQAVYNE